MSKKKQFFFETEMSLFIELMETNAQSTKGYKKAKEIGSKANQEVHQSIKKENIIDEQDCMRLRNEDFKRYP